MYKRFNWIHQLIFHSDTICKLLARCVHKKALLSLRSRAKSLCKYAMIFSSNDDLLDRVMALNELPVEHGVVVYHESLPNVYLLWRTLNSVCYITKRWTRKAFSHLQGHSRSLRMVLFDRKYRSTFLLFFHCNVFYVVPFSRYHRLSEN